MKDFKEILEKIAKENGTTPEMFCRRCSVRLMKHTITMMQAHSLYGI